MKQPIVATVPPRSTSFRRTETTTLSRSRLQALGSRALHLLSAVVWCLLLAGVAQGSDNAVLPAAEPDTRSFVFEPVADPLRADEARALAKLLANREPDDALIIDGLPKRVLHKLQQAYPLALQQVREVESCASLFAELSADGVRMLSTTIYRPATSSRDMKTCGSRGAVAFTTVGRPHTRVCEGFARLPQRQAAMFLIHEALHHAGLGEYPLDPDGMRSTEINRLVCKSCRL